MTISETIHSLYLMLGMLPVFSFLTVALPKEMLQLHLHCGIIMPQGGLQSVQHALPSLRIRKNFAPLFLKVEKVEEISGRETYLSSKIGHVIHVTCADIHIEIFNIK